MTVTHQGMRFGVAPTRKHVEMTGMTMARVHDGKIYEAWGKQDTQGLMRQLGAARATARLSRNRRCRVMRR